MTQQHEKISENKTAVTSANIGEGTTAVQLKDNRTASVVQQKLSEKTTTRQTSFTPVQTKANNTGLPENLKSGIENLSGHSMDDVKVHYNSDKPAQLNAHAYAQGTDIHIASGQEKHLPHEAWHVVQQKQGRVKPTLQMKGKVNVNDNKGLEKEADIMGAKAYQFISKPLEDITQNKQQIPTNYSPKEMQLKAHQEILTNNPEVEQVVQAKSNNVSVPIIQRLGTNVNMVAEDDRHFETPSGKVRLRVNPDADAYLEGQFEKGSAAKHADASLGDKFTHAMEHVHKGIPYNRQGKIDALNEHRQPLANGELRKERGLGVMLHGNAATCWEKAAFFHLVLAELGIPTTMEGGYRKSDGGGHAWLVVKPHPDFFGGKSIVIDPTTGKVSNRAVFEKNYNITVPAKAVATPKVAQAPKDIEKALHEFLSISSLGGIIKKAVVEIVELKIERAMNERKREAERVEFEKLLAEFRNSLK
ncbi:DUF4157 domain-containing protein [uncultured Flavobacterium sp.]|uniref:eCIS core domain-containing protein n=1 Tax=uncultured Flavobacterium sp. TaxID=165435 RepID=UPI00292CF3F1|nr:DUF4157 domain-containing protein [uncultured Flavobacterium sp.]